VGKTQFVGEGMARSAAAGLVAVRGECLPLAGTLPLLPVMQALRELGGLRGGRLLEEGLAAAPAYVPEEVGRLLPRLGRSDGIGAGAQGEGWQRERLFSAVADLLDAVAGRAEAGVGVVVEDVHWADSATLDLLTFLARAGCGDAVRVVATCRGDEAPLAGQVADWLAHVRGAAGVQEIRLGPLSRLEVAGQVAALAGGPAPAPVVDELYARAEGNPFFTEQLVAAALAGAAGGDLQVPAGLPARLAGLLAARAGRCAGDARVVLAALAVAGRPLSEDLLGEVSGLDAEAVRRGLRELAAARLLAEDTAGGAHRPRHALLAEAVAAELLPGERAAWHERTARALQAAGGDTLAAEAAGHWQAADRPAKELPARIAAAAAAERVFGYAQAAVHWQRTIELVPALPEGAAQIPDAEVARLYLRAIHAADRSGDIQQAGLLAEEAYQRFAGHPDPATAAAIHYRAGIYRSSRAPEAARPLFEESLRLFELAPPSAEHAEALSRYGYFLLMSYERWQDNHTLQLQAAEVAQAAGATAPLGGILAALAAYELMANDGEGFATLQRARRAAEASGDSMAVLTVDGFESALMLVSGDFTRAEQVALRGLDAARRVGLADWSNGANLAENAACAIWSQGRTADAAALIDPLTTGAPRADNWGLHVHRALLDMLRGDLGAATARQRQVSPLTGLWGHEEARFAAEQTAEVALWSGRPSDAIAEVRQALAPYENITGLTEDCGRLLVAGLRACADLAEQARARRDDPAAQAAESAARELGCMAEGMEQVPFTDHPHVGAIPAARATWQAEWTRLGGASDPAAWHAAAKTWESLGCPHRAGYALWRQAEAQLDAGQPVTAAAATLRAAAAAADGHAPLLAQVRALAQRARIPLQAPPAALGETAPVPGAAAPYGLTSRELTVLRLLAEGRTNAQIGAELYISPTTARVHVSNILRKLGVTSRVQAAAVAERAGLLRSGQP
jgi:DNA-binding CsgD family transcriptional regulator